MSLNASQYICGNGLLINGRAVLILGPAGVGKSRLSLQMIEKGHALIADDMVYISSDASHTFLHSIEQSFGYMEVRGLGLINIGDLFGKSALSKTGECRLIVHLIEQFKLNDRLCPYKPSLLPGLEGIPEITLDASLASTLPLYVETALKHVCSQRFNLSNSENGFLLENEDVCI